MFYTIYKIINIIDGKIYIGMHKTKNIDDGYMGSGKYLKRAIEKYGRENFKKEILFVFDNEDEMKSKEKELVTEEFLSRNDVYNLCPGGKGGFGYINKNGFGRNMFLGKKHSKNTKQILSEKATGKKHSEETLKKLRNFFSENHPFFEKNTLKKPKRKCLNQKTLDQKILNMEP